MSDSIAPPLSVTWQYSAVLSLRTQEQKQLMIHNIPKVRNQNVPAQLPILGPTIQQSTVSVVIGFYLGRSALADFSLSPDVLKRHLATTGPERFMETITSINELAPLLKRIETFEDTLPSDPQRRELAKTDYSGFATDFKREFALHIETLIERNMPAEAISMSGRFADKALLRAVAQKQIARSLSELLSADNDSPEVYLSYLRFLCKYNVSLLGMSPSKRKKNRSAHNWLSDLIKYKLKPLRKLLQAGTDAQLLERLATNEQIECVRHFSNCNEWQIKPALDLIDSSGKHNCSRYNLVFKILNRWNEETAKNFAARLSSAAKLVRKQPASSLVQKILYFVDDEDIDAEFIDHLSSNFEKMALRENDFETAGLSADQRQICRSLAFFWKHCDRTMFAQFASLLFEHEKWYPRPLKMFSKAMGDHHRLIRLCSILTKSDPKAASDLLKKIHSTPSKFPSLRCLEFALPGLAKMEGLFDALVWGLKTEKHSSIETIVRLGSAISFINPSRIEEQLHIISGSQRDSTTMLATSSHWSSLIGIDSALDEAIYRYRSACDIEGIADRIPQSVAAVGLHKDRYLDEIEYLERRLTAESSQVKQQHLSKRLASLQCRVTMAEVHCPKAIRKAVKSLQQRTHRLTLQALRKVIASECCRKVGFSDEQIADPRIVDATFLLGQILADDYAFDNTEQNAPLLLKILKAIACGAADVRAELAGNKTFLADLQRQDICAENWQAPFEMTFASDLFDGGHVRIYAESDPLEILPMGTRFDTCLSVFGPYFGDVVATAVDFNKKVLYAKDGAGRIVARKVIAVSRDFKLLGFPVYSFERPEKYARLTDLFIEYGEVYAGFTKLELAQDGEVKSIHGCSDYMDNCTPWTTSARAR